MKIMIDEGDKWSRYEDNDWWWLMNKIDTKIMTDEGDEYNIYKDNDWWGRWI